MNDNYARVTFLGTTNVGKTSLILKIVDDSFDTYLENTVMVDFKRYQYTYNQQEIKLALWDTAGQETYRSITTQYLRGSKFYILVCAVNDLHTLEELDYFMELVHDKGDSGSKIFLLCNKYDLDESQHVINCDKLEAFKKANNIYEHYFVSAKSGEGIPELLEMIAKVITGNNIFKNDLQLNTPEEADGNKKKCC